MATVTQQVGPLMKLLMMGIGNLSKEFYQKYGDESLPIIERTAQLGGVEYGKLMLQMMPVHDMKSAVESMKMMDSMMEMGMTPIEVSDTTVRFKISKCPLAIEGTDKKLCQALMMNDKQMMSTFLGREVDMNILRSVAAGDRECEVIYTFK